MFILKMNRKKVAALFMILGILPQSVSFAAEKLDQYNLDEIVVTASCPALPKKQNATFPRCRPSMVRTWTASLRHGNLSVC